MNCNYEDQYPIQSYQGEEGLLERINREGGGLEVKRGGQGRIRIWEDGSQPKRQMGEIYPVNCSPVRSVTSFGK